MGNQLCCLGPPEVAQDDNLFEEDVLGSVDVETQYDNFAQNNVKNSVSNPVAVTQDTSIEVESLVSNPVMEVAVGKNTQHHHRQGSDHMPKRKNSPSELDGLSELDDVDTEDDTVFVTGRQVESDLDGSTDDSISALEEPFTMTTNYQDDEIKETEKNPHGKDQGSHQYLRKPLSQISLQVQTMNVVEAGNPAVNGVYRWFAAHGRFVMFTDQGQYQIMGGVNLSEYGDRYYDCWVIEEITANVVRLYAVASNNSTSISCDGWICIQGASPAPKVKGENREFEEDSYTAGSESSIALIATPYLPQQWAASLAGIDGIEWVA